MVFVESDSLGRLPYSNVRTVRIPLYICVCNAFAIAYVCGNRVSLLVNSIVFSALSAIRVYIRDEGDFHEEIYS